MSRNDHLLDKQDKNDLKEYDALIRKTLNAKRKIEDGFLDLAESIFEIHHKKIYKLKYKTFGEFCEEELGFSRQTIYVYISILKLIANYPNYFSREKTIEFGHKKMRYITEGISEIDKKVSDQEQKEKLKKDIFDSIKPSMPSTEIESIIDDKIEDL